MFRDSILNVLDKKPVKSEVNESKPGLKDFSLFFFCRYDFELYVKCVILSTMRGHILLLKAPNVWGTVFLILATT